MGFFVQNTEGQSSYHIEMDGDTPQQVNSNTILYASDPANEPTETQVLASEVNGTFIVVHNTSANVILQTDNQTINRENAITYHTRVRDLNFFYFIIIKCNRNRSIYI